MKGFKMLPLGVASLFLCASVLVGSSAGGASAATPVVTTPTQVGSPICDADWCDEEEELADLVRKQNKPKKKSSDSSNSSESSKKREASTSGDNSPSSKSSKNCTGSTRGQTWDLQYFPREDSYNEFVVVGQATVWGSGSTADCEGWLVVKVNNKLPKNVQLTASASGGGKSSTKNCTDGCVTNPVGQPMDWYIASSKGELYVGHF